MDHLKDAGLATPVLTEQEVEAAELELEVDQTAEVIDVETCQHHIQPFEAILASPRGLHITGLTPGEDTPTQERPAVLAEWMTAVSAGPSDTGSLTTAPD